MNWSFLVECFLRATMQQSFAACSETYMDLRSESGICMPEAPPLNLDGPRFLRSAGNSRDYDYRFCVECSSYIPLEGYYVRLNHGRVSWMRTWVGFARRRSLAMDGFFVVGVQREFSSFWCGFISDEVSQLGVPWSRPFCNCGFGTKNWWRVLKFVSSQSWNLKILLLTTI